MPGSDTSLFKHARAASTVRVDQVSRGGLSCLFVIWTPRLLIFLTEIGGREVVDVFRNYIGTSVVYVLCTQGSHID